MDLLQQPLHFARLDVLQKYLTTRLPHVPSRGAGSSNLYYADLGIMPICGDKSLLTVMSTAMRSA
jgi:hypothetical protein